MRVISSRQRKWNYVNVFLPFLFFSPCFSQHNLWYCSAIIFSIFKWYLNAKQQEAWTKNRKTWIKHTCQAINFFFRIRSAGKCIPRSFKFIYFHLSHFVDCFWISSGHSYTSISRFHLTFIHTMATMAVILNKVCSQWKLKLGKNWEISEHRNVSLC